MNKRKNLNLGSGVYVFFALSAYFMLIDINY